MAPWGWSKKIETCWSNFKCFNVERFYVCALVGVLIKCLYSRFPLGSFPGVCFIYADVSEPSISSIFTLHTWHNTLHTSHFTPLPMKMELIEGSETSAYINQTPRNDPKWNLLYSVHGESLKSRRFSTDILKQRYQNLNNVLPMGAELFYADRRTDKHD